MPGYHTAKLVVPYGASEFHGTLHTGEGVILATQCLEQSLDWFNVHMQVCNATRVCTPSSNKFRTHFDIVLLARAAHRQGSDTHSMTPRAITVMVHCAYASVPRHVSVYHVLKRRSSTLGYDITDRSLAHLHRQLKADCLVTVNLKIVHRCEWSEWCKCWPTLSHMQGLQRHVGRLLQDRTHRPGFIGICGMQESVSEHTSMV